MPITNKYFKAQYIKITVLFISVISIVMLKTLSANVGAACAALPTDTGSAKQTFSTEVPGSYYPWIHMKAANTTNDSVWLQIDDNCGINVGDSDVTTNSWTWVNWQDGFKNNKMTVSLDVGEHTIKLVGKELGVKIDGVTITTDATCVPDGNGANCASAAPAAVVPVPISTTPAPVNTNTAPTPEPPTTATPIPVTTKTTGPAASETKQIPVSNHIIVPPNENALETPDITSGDLAIEVSATGAVDELNAYVDGQNIAQSNSDTVVVDTDKLPNGTNELTLQTTTKDGKTTKSKKTLYVKNRKSFWSRIHYTITSPYHFILRHLTRN